jgi:Protein of unknown function (DUF2795)
MNPGLCTLQHVARRRPAGELLRLVRALPDRVYHNAAEIAVAVGELKRRRPVTRTDSEPPSRKGGPAAARTARSAAGLARILTGTGFPAVRADLKRRARANRTAVAHAEAILKDLERLPDRCYRSIAEVAHAMSRKPSQVP